MEEIVLQVHEALDTAETERVVYFDEVHFDKLELNPEGDYVIIKRGDKETTIQAKALYQYDERYLKVIQMNEKVRQELEVREGDKVTIAKGKKPEQVEKEQGVRKPLPEEKIISSRIEEVKPVSFKEIGGLDAEIRELRELIEIPLRFPQLARKLDISLPKGILFIGPPGTGKTLTAKALISQLDITPLFINGTELITKYYGETEKQIRDLFDEAKLYAPSIIFIDEIDSLIAKRTSGKDYKINTLLQLNSLMDGIEEYQNVIVVGSTNAPELIDESIRRAGRFEYEIYFKVPDIKARQKILEIHTRKLPLEENVDLFKISCCTAGYVGADLKLLSREAARSALRRIFPELLKEQKVPDKPIRVIESDFKRAMERITPSAVKEIFIEIPHVLFKDIGGLEEAKKNLFEVIILPLRQPEKFKQLGITPPKGVLLYGPPGTGKTLLGKAIATETEANFIPVNGPEIMNKWVGESEKAIRKIFDKARQTSPSIIFLDEIDAITPRRESEAGTHVTERIVNQFLIEMQGLEELENVAVIAATNRPDIIDPALLRPGRFDRLIYVGAPTEKERLEILEKLTQKMKIDASVNLKSLAKKTENFVGSDLYMLCVEAGICALREEQKKITQQHFGDALQKIKPTVNKENLKKYEQF